MFRTTRSPASLLAAVPALLLSGAAHAVVVLGAGDSINLGTLLQSEDRTVIVADKMFVFRTFTTSQFDSNLFSVIGFVSTATNQWGLRNVGFDITGPFGDATPGNQTFAEMNLQYTVSVLPEFYDRGVRLHDCRLTFNGSAGGGGSFARVDESVTDLDRNAFLGQMSAFYNANDPDQVQYVDALDFSPNGYRAFEVNKDIKFFANGDEDFATASFIRQEFSQVPAPGAIALMGLGGFAAMRRRRA